MDQVELNANGFDLLSAATKNWERLQQNFAAAKTHGDTWLVECRDLSEAFDADAGVYFSPCQDDAAVDELVTRCSDENHYDRVLGIYDLRRPLNEQSVGLTRAEWLAGRRG